MGQPALFLFVLVMIIESGMVVKSMNYDLSFFLASIGISTITYLGWQFLKPFVEFLASSKRVLATSWFIFIVLMGGAFVGYAYESLGSGLFMGIGWSCLGMGCLGLLIYWSRQLVLWDYGEKDEG